MKTWLDEGLNLLRPKGREGLVAWLQPRVSKLRGKKPAALNSLLGYLRSGVGITNYPVYRDHNWQIGSGMIEATAKQLVGIRLKGPHMHWSPLAASAITALRAQNINNNWHQIWKTLVI
ncbi:MAG: hypothetical protein R3C20_07685 [Planctomycetaceae bacterium]